jgi:predicted DNA-binding transcriptional regulator AlpA
MNQTLETPAPAVVPALWLSGKDVAALLGIGQRTLWRMLDAGQVPQPHRFTRKLVRWDRAELFQFVENLRTTRQAKEGR